MAARAKCPCCSQNLADRTRKVQCEVCGYNYRTARSWLQVKPSDCPHCGGAVHAVCVDDRALYDEAGAWAQWREVEEDRRPKAPWRLGERVQDRCKAPSCYSFISSPSATCKKCGFDNGRGRYAEAAIPF